MGPRWRTARGADRRAQLVVVLALAGFVLGTYLVVVLGGGLLLGRAGSPSLGLSVLATAVVALGLEPVQRRVESVLRARAGSAPSPYDVLRRFGGTVVDGEQDDSVPAHMARLLAEGVGARWAQVWLTAQDRLVLAASWPPGEAGDADVPLARGSDDADGSRREVVVRHGGRVYGVLRVQPGETGSLTSVEERLMAGLAAQAGLVLRLLSLRGDLAARHDELVASTGDLERSRARLIETQDGERRRLERDLHDGAQQHLVALAVNLRLAQTVAGRSPERADAILAGQVEAARAATQTLTDLARGVLPPVLGHDGLAAALRGALGPAAGTVALEAAELPRLPRPVEAALYFVVLEAVQNAGKHASGAPVTVRVQVVDDVAVATVSDGGAGFDLATVRTDGGGTGLGSMDDRLRAVGGSLRVDATPGHGARVQASVPVPVLARTSDGA